MASETFGRSHGAAALDAVDRALRKQPHKADQEFSAATEHLAALRDAMIDRQRRDGATPESRLRLEHVNAVISVVLAGHFPLGEIPWDEVRKARDWLAEVVAG